MSKIYSKVAEYEDTFSKNTIYLARDTHGVTANQIIIYLIPHHSMPQISYKMQTTWSNHWNPKTEWWDAAPRRLRFLGGWGMFLVHPPPQIDWHDYPSWIPPPVLILCYLNSCCADDVFIKPPLCTPVW